MLRCNVMLVSTKNNQAFAAILTLEEPRAVATLEISKAESDSGFEFGYRPELDGFRGTAILLVVAGHFLEFHTTSRAAHEFALAIAQLGVLLFFVLSGFLITGILHSEKKLTGGVDFRKFYTRRVLRLAPALLMFLFAVGVLVRLGLVTDVTSREFLECLFYSRNIFGHSMSLGHIWSLSLEEQFYLLWPLTFSLLAWKRGPAIIAWVCGGFMVWRGLAIALHLFSYDLGVFYVRPYFRFDSILIGALVALWLGSSETRLRRVRKLARECPSGVLWGAVGIWALIGEGTSRPLHITVSEILVAAALAQVVLMPDSWAGTILRHRGLRYLGTISYSVYLWQELFVTADSPTWGVLRQFPLAIVCPVAIAIASYHLVEKPILGLKDHFAPHVVLSERQSFVQGRSGLRT